MKVVITGNGVAGINVAKTLAESDRELEIEVYAEEKYHYYQRPNLIELLAGKVKLEQIYAYQPSWYDKKKIKVLLDSKVTKIIPASKEIEIKGNVKVGYDKLLLATGSLSNVPPIPGIDKKGIFTFYRVDDVFKIREWAEDKKKAVVIGGGLLGLESGRALMNLGLEVTVIEFLPWLLPKQLDQDGAQILRSELQRMGVKILVNSKTEKILGDQNTEGVMLEDHTRIPAELVLLAAGTKPDKKLAEGCGLKTDRGIIVNQFMQTSDPDIYSCGDVTQFENRCYGIIPAALEQSRIAALNILEHNSASYQGTTPSTTLKIVGIDLVSIGESHAQGKDIIELVKKESDRCLYKKLAIRDGKIIGAILLGDRKNALNIKRAIDKKTDVKEFVQKLLDEDFDWKKIE
jgi:nitrite reductase (NADH) large subunit